VVQLVAYPLGVGWTMIMPNRAFKTFGLQWNLNPGPFNLKEHGIIVIMANAAFGNGVGYFTDTIVAQRGFYGQNFGWGFNIMLAFTTQCIGFGMAGMMRKYLVEPASMLWPRTLVNTAFLYALHDHSKTDPAKSNGWSISRYRYFLYVFIGSFAWYWFPGYSKQARLNARNIHLHSHSRQVSECLCVCHVDQAKERRDKPIIRRMDRHFIDTNNL
jgi:OPT family oligopeptide transporter